MTKNLSCNDLYNSGYKRTFGIDVIMIGKIMNDTMIHYQIDIPARDFKELDFSSLEENTPVKIKTVKKITKYDKYLEMEALELNDSIYEFVWGSIKQQQKDVCKEGLIGWRNLILKLNESEIKNYRKTIDTLKYKAFNYKKHSENSYVEESFNVLNLKQKDTFYCLIYKQEDQYLFSSTITIKND
ncbi:MAG: hypothetical protein V3V28_13715 [Polaribacter sp.]|uniref:hypothetical protein n=1 Tax=Polaribacter sp. TaxID=1920175 RepID=UPI002F35C620